jgi:hypothetical protein
MQKSTHVTKRAKSHTVEVSVNVRVSEPRSRKAKPAAKDHGSKDKKVHLLREEKEVLGPEEIGFMKKLLNAMGDTGVWTDEALAREAIDKAGAENLELLKAIQSDLAASRPVASRINISSTATVETWEFAAGIFLKVSPNAARQFLNKALDKNYLG